MNKYICMVGIPASGKSLYAQNIAEQENAVVHSSDVLRKEMFGDECVNDKNNVLFTELHKRIKSDLKAGRNVIYDACNISYKRRKAFIKELKGIECEKICCLVATPYKKLFKSKQAKGKAST